MSKEEWKLYYNKNKETIKQNRNRRYTTDRTNGKRNILVSWIQHKCKRCKRFIGGHRHGYCEECYKITKAEKRKLNTLTGLSVSECNTLRNNIFYHVDTFNVGDIL